MGPELIKNGSFENLSASFVADTTGNPFPQKKDKDGNIVDPGTIADPGTMTLVEGSNMLRDWFVPYGPIALMTKDTHRVWPSHIGPPGSDADHPGSRGTIFPRPDVQRPTADVR